MPQSRRDTCDLGSRMVLGSQVWNSACVLIHASLALGIQPQYLTAEVRASTERALAARSMPGVLSTAARVASQIHRDGPQTTDLLRFVAHVMGSTAVLCYVHTPIGPRAVLYKPMHVTITCMVELFLWSGHCILLVPPGAGASTPWAEAQQHVDRLSQFMRVDHAWCMSFGVSFAATSTTASGVGDLGRWLSFDDSTGQTLTMAEERMVQSAAAGAPQAPKEHGLVGRAFREALMAGGDTDPTGSGAAATGLGTHHALWAALGGRPDADDVDQAGHGNGPGSCRIPMAQSGPLHKRFDRGENELE